MKNNDQLKQFISEIGFDRTLQCLIEVLDDSIHNENIIPLWKLKVVEYLEQAYDGYMNPDNDPSYENA
jgi:hypothetical protein